MLRLLPVLGVHWRLTQEAVQKQSNICKINVASDRDTKPTSIYEREASTHLTYQA